MLISADNERSEARHTRLAESTPTIPMAIYWFLLIALAVTLAAQALSLPRRTNETQVTALVAVAALMVGALLIIRDVERPFSGAISVPPTAISDTADDIGEDYAAAYPAHRLPCDDEGNKEA